MFKDTQAFNGFSVSDLQAAKYFYGTTLGVEVQDDPMGFQLKFATGGTTFVYQKDDHEPATYTILNFPVENIDQAVDELVAKGVTFEQYPNMTDEKNIARGIERKQGPDIAWFKDPAGNILAVLQEA